MKDNSARLLEILNEDQLGFFTLLEFEWNSNHFYTDIGYDITWEGNTYLSDNPIVNVERPRYSNIVDREAFKLTLSGLDQRIIDEVEQGINSLPVRMRMVFTIDGTPQVGVRDTLLFYDGLTSRSSTTISKDSKVITIECTAPLANLDEIGTLFTTKDGMKMYDPTDTCFDSVSENSDPTNIKWGKV